MGTMRGIVFDMDGVLTESEGWWDEVRRAVTAKHGGVWQPESTAAMMGMSTPEWARYLVEDLGAATTPEAIAAEVVGEMVRRYESGPPVIDGAVEAVRDAASRAPVAIATSAPPALVEALLDATGLHGEVRFVVSSEQVGAGKPDPAVYLRAAEGIGIDPADCVAIEDSTNGLRAALAAGMTVIATPSEEHPPPEEVLARAHAIIGSVAELPMVLDGLFPRTPS